MTALRRSTASWPSSLDDRVFSCVLVLNWKKKNHTVLTILYINLQPISIESNGNSRSLTARKTEKMEPRIHAPTADSKSKANGFGSCRRRAEVRLTVARTPLPFNATHSSHPILAGAAPVSQISPAACGRAGLSSCAVVTSTAT